MDKHFLRTPPLGGIQVPHHKDTAECETAPLLSPERVTVLLAQHIGKPAKRCVERGDRVLVGTRIGAADGFVSANIHAPVSGTVADIVSVTAPGGAVSEAVEIESDGAFTPDPAIRPPVVKNADDLVSAIAQSGLVGLGGAGFPTHVKFSLPPGGRVDTLVVNGAECEPYITSDYRQMVEDPDGVVEGMRVIRDLLGLGRAVIGIEDNKPRAIELLREKSAPHGLEVQALKSSYPQGAEKVLIARMTGRAVPAGKLPADAGVVIVNVTTCAFVARYLKTGMPLVAKRVTVAGDAIAKPGNLLAPVGTKVAELIAACGGYREEPEKLLMGGPMMGLALYSDDFPLLKNNNGILALTSRQVTETGEYPCIRCGRCVDACPMYLPPAEIQVSYATGDAETTEKLGVMNCIECGSCTYVCPAKRPITQIMRLGKDQVRKAAKKK